MSVSLQSQLRSVSKECQALRRDLAIVGKASKVTVADASPDLLRSLFNGKKVCFGNNLTLRNNHEEICSEIMIYWQKCD
jgi:hypothetical protein